MFSRFKTFFREVKLEFKHVNWLTKQEAIRYTLIVVGMSLALAAFLGAFDFLFNFLLAKFIIS